MKTLLLTGLAGLSFLAADALADDRYSGLSSQLVINAGSGLVVHNSVANRNYNDRNRNDYRDRNDRNDRNRNRNHNRNDRNRHDDRYRDDHRNDRNSYNGISTVFSTGNLSITWSDGDYRNSRPSYTYNNSSNGRHDNGRHLGQERREGRYLKDRYGNCFRIDGSSRNERRVKVRDSYCRF